MGSIDGRNQQADSSSGGNGLSRRQLLAAGAGAAGVAAGAGLIGGGSAADASTGFAVGAAAPSAAPITKAYMQITGKVQGQFKGEKGFSIGIRSYALDVETPRDASTGLASGRRQWKPIVITKVIGPASPQLLSALTNGESLQTVVINLVRASQPGKLTTYYTITLTNAQVVGLSQFANDSPERHSMVYPLEEFEEVQFTFQKIEISDKPGGTSAQDDWQQPT